MRNNRSQLRAFGWCGAAAAALLVSLVAAAQAQSVDPAVPGRNTAQSSDTADKAKPGDGKTVDDWRFAVAIYGWATNLSGSATARGNTVDINASVIDLIQKSDSLAAFDGYVEANKGRFGLYGDLVWAKLGIPASAAVYRNPIAGVKLSLQANAAVTTSLTIVEAGGLYELVKWQGGEQSYTAIDALVGGRFWNMSTQVNLDLTGAIGFSDPRLAQFDRSKTIGIADSGTLSWVDPLVGLRLRHQFSPSQQFALRGDIGGFGIPGSSLLTWQLSGIYSYTWQFTGYSLSAGAGYRALSTNINFDNGPNSSNLNLVIHGPLIGAAVKF